MTSARFQAATSPGCQLENGGLASQKNLINKAVSASPIRVHPRAWFPSIQPSVSAATGNRGHQRRHSLTVAAEISAGVIRGNQFKYFLSRRSCQLSGHRIGYSPGRHGRSRDCVHIHTPGSPREASRKTRGAKKGAAEPATRPCRLRGGARAQPLGARDAQAASQSRQGSQRVFERA